MLVVDIELSMTAGIDLFIRNFIFFPTSKLFIAFRRSFRQPLTCRTRNCITTRLWFALYTQYLPQT